MNRDAVLVGYNFTTILGMARLLGRSGYTVRAIRTGRPAGSFVKRIGLAPEARSRYIKRHEFLRVGDDNGILRLLTEDFPREQSGKAVLIPVDDMSAELIDGHYDALKPYYVMQNVGDQQGGITRLMNKELQKQLARQAGLRVAEGCTLHIRDGCFTIPEEIVYPCFIKSDVPMAARKRLMRICQDRKTLELALNSIAAERKDCVLLVEEYIHIEREYCIVGVCDRQKVCIPEVIEETVMGHGAHAGVTCFGRVLKPEGFRDFVEKLRKLLSGLNYQGLFTVDMMESGGKRLFCELNLRLGGSGCAVAGAGVDIVNMHAASLLGEDAVKPNAICREIAFIGERPLVNDLVNGYITRKEYKDYQAKAEYCFINDPKDKGPSQAFGIYIFRERVKGFLKSSKASQEGA